LPAEDTFFSGKLPLRILFENFDALSRVHAWRFGRVIAVVLLMTTHSTLNWNLHYLGDPTPNTPPKRNCFYERFLMITVPGGTVPGSRYSQGVIKWEVQRAVGTYDKECTLR